MTIPGEKAAKEISCGLEKTSKTRKKHQDVHMKECEIQVMSGITRLYPSVPELFQKIRYVLYIHLGKSVFILNGGYFESYPTNSGTDGWFGVSFFSPKQSCTTSSK